MERKKFNVLKSIYIYQMYEQYTYFGVQKSYIMPLEFKIDAEAIQMSLNK